MHKCNSLKLGYCRVLSTLFVSLFLLFPQTEIDCFASGFRAPSLHTAAGTPPLDPVGRDEDNSILAGDPAPRNAIHAYR